MQKFNLRRYYALVSLVGITAVIVGLSLFSRHEAVRNLLEHQALANEDITNSFANSVWPQFVRLLGRSKLSENASELHNGDELDQLWAITAAQMRNTNVVKVKIYDLDGLTVFSTDPTQIGEDKSENAAFLSALNGTVVSDITFREKFDAFEQTIQDRNLIASYIPIRESSQDTVIAVFEVYSDVTPLVASLDATQNKIVTVVTLSLATLYLFLYFMVNRAHSVISHQENIREANEEKIRQQAFTDSLTQLPNRDQFVEDITSAIEQAKLNETQGALMFLDLDRFKIINDSLGHDAGDQLLRVIASRIQECTGTNDTAFRISGDEFIVLMQELSCIEDASALAKNILSTIRKPITLGSQEVIANISIGITTFSSSNNSVDRLVKEADAAMYRAKKTTSNRFEFYSTEMNMIANETLQMETELQRALASEQFVVYYQPKVDSETREIISVEALLRWQHPEKGLIPPNTFIPYLEETGLITAVGNWVLQEACQQAQSWISAGFVPLRMSVNMSAKQFRDKNLANTVRQVLEKTGLEARYLELELTESMFIEDTDFAIQVMQQLKELGVLLSIDDFGSGYSSLSYLKHFPVDFLKIDRSFVQDVANNDKDNSILSAIATLANSLELGLIAEGVENEAQFKRLQDKGCDELQGFLFSRPIPAEEFEARYFQTFQLKAG